MAELTRIGEEMNCTSECLQIIRDRSAVHVLVHHSSRCSIMCARHGLLVALPKCVVSGAFSLVQFSCDMPVVSGKCLPLTTWLPTHSKMAVMLLNSSQFKCIHFCYFMLFCS